MEEQRKGSGAYENSCTAADIIDLAITTGKHLFPLAFPDTGVKPNRQACERFMDYITPIVQFCTTVDQNASLPSLRTHTLVGNAPFLEYLRTTSDDRFVLNFRRDNCEVESDDYWARYARLFPKRESGDIRPRDPWFQYTGENEDSDSNPWNQYSDYESDKDSSSSDGAHWPKSPKV